MKDFNEFLDSLSDKDWSLVAQDIAQKSDTATDPDAKLIAAAIRASLVVLREYHDWLNSDSE